MKQLHGTHDKPGGLDLCCSPEFMCESQRRAVTRLVYFTNNILIWTRAIRPLPLSFFILCFHVVVFGPGDSTLKEPLNAAEHSVGVMRETAVSAARRCRLSEGRGRRLRHQHSCCSWLTTSRCITGRIVTQEGVYQNI